MHKGELEEGEHQALRRKVEEVEFTKGEVASKEALAFGGSLEIDQDPGFSNLMGGSAVVVPVVVVVVDEAFTVAVRVNPEERGVAERPARVVVAVQLGVPSRVLLPLLLQPTGTAPRRTVYWKKVVARVTVAEVMRKRELLGVPISEARMSTPPAHPAAVQSSRG